MKLLCPGYKRPRPWCLVPYMCYKRTFDSTVPYCKQLCNISFERRDDFSFSTQNSCFTKCTIYRQEPMRTIAPCLQPQYPLASTTHQIINTN
uniref:Uncharacterized protein n=1 Tax=Rhizophora mucronata TaxID=61149 RepID=A0A2P2IQ24_RHIMU